MYAARKHVNRKPVLPYHFRARSEIGIFKVNRAGSNNV